MGLCWSLRDGCCWRRVPSLFLFDEQNGFSTEPPIFKSSNAVGGKGVSMPGLKIAPTSSWSFSQSNWMSSRSADTGYTLVSISCAPTLESTSSLFSCVPCWLGLTGTRAWWLFKHCCLWDKNKLQAAREISWEHKVLSWTRSFTVRVTVSGPKSGDHSIPSLETEKIILPQCRLNVYKIKMSMMFWLTVSTNGVSTRLSTEWRIFYFFWFSFGWVFLFRSRNLSFW